MRRSLSTRQRLWVPTMNERESMQELMKREQEEMLVTINRANSALMRIFKIEEGEGEDE
jgi:hypothetical protein